MSKIGSLTKWDQSEQFSQVLQEECPGLLISVPEMRRIVGRVFNVVARQSYYNHISTLEEVFGSIETVEGQGVRVLPTQERPESQHEPEPGTSQPQPVSRRHPS